MIQLYNGDCLELMKNIPDGSVDLVLTDPPYGTIQGLYGVEWDTPIDTDILFPELYRVLRNNGKCILFAQEPFTSKLITNAMPTLPFSYKAIWKKDTAGNILSCKKSMVSLYEDICIFSKMNLDFKKENPLRATLKKYVDKYGKDYLIELFEISGKYSTKGSARVQCSYKFGFTNGQRVDIFNKKEYDYLSKYIDFEESYEELTDINREYKNRYVSIFNLWQGGKSKSNVLEYAKDNDGYHPTQKPVKLLEDLIQTYSNEGNTVLDFTMGSGSCGVASVNTNRNFIGIELDKVYFDIAEKRINEAQNI